MSISTETGKQSGFSLLELIISCTMLGIVVMGIAMVFPAAQATVSRNKLYTVGINMAQEKLGEFERLPWNDAEISAGAHGPETIGVYARQWDVTDNSPFRSMKTIVVEVSWATGASTGEVRLITYKPR